MGVAVSTSRASQGATPLALIEEISHRVLNEYTHAIATLSLAAAEIGDAKARLALAAVADRLRAHAELHRALRRPGDCEPSDLGVYLQALCAALSTAILKDRDIALTFIQAQAPLTADRCWRVGLIVSELVTNVVRHAFHERRRRIVIEVCAGIQLTYCRVSDNGRAGVSSRRPGRGRAIIDSLASQLGGRVQWSFGSAGTTALLAFPTEPPPPP